MASDTLVCPILVGRAGPTARLRTLVDGIADSARDPADTATQTMVLVGGEAGLGKSRLIAEAAAYAASHGYRVLVGASFPQDRASPFAPIVDLLRATLSGLPPDDAARLARPFARELATLVPDLVPTPRGPAGQPDDADPERDRRQLFVALAHCLLGGSPSPPAPTCLVVEDLHWCDEASLDFLAFLVRGQGRPAARLPLLLLATYRVEDAEPGLSAWLAQLDRARLVDEIALAPLDRDETFQMLAATFGGAQLPVGLVDAIHELAEGNPFRIEELVGALVAAGEAHPDPGPTGEGGVWRWNARPVHEWRLPRSLYEAVRERLAGVGPAARELLTLAAVVGRRFDFELLQRLAQVDERTLLALVKELVAAGLVIEESPDRFAFRHALTRQAVYGELLARERLALHRTVAEIFEQTYAEALDRHVDDLAYHFSEANAWPKALTYARRAADRARLLYAPRASMAHLSRAIEACRHLPEAQPGTLAVLHLERARANDTVGDAPAAIADARVSLDFAHQAGDRRAEWQALIDLGLFWAGRDYSRAGPCFEAALDLARGLDDPVMQAHSLNRLGNWRVNAEQPRDALPYHHEALAIFERLGDRAGIAATLDLLGMAAFLCADLTSCMRYYERAAALMEELDDRPGLVTSLAILSGRGGTYELGSATTGAAELDQGVRDGERAIQLAREIGWPAGEAFALAQFASTLGLRGEYPRALEAADRAREIARSIDHVQWGTSAHAVLGALYLDLLAFERARRHLERALELAHRIRSRFWVQFITGVLAWTHTQAGDLDLAATLLATVDPLPCPSAADASVSSLGERWVVFAHAHLAVARNDPEHALRLFDRVTAPSVEPATDDGEPAPSRPALTPRPALGRALALSALGRTEEAEALLLGVREIVRRQGVRSILWRVQLALGKLYDRAGRTEDAQPAYLAARQIVEAFAAELPDPELRDVLIRRTLAMLPRAYRPATRPAPGANRPGGLTARECDVAALIADGRTNREIAERLVLGERTIETHVSNILGKLDVSSRRDVARWAQAHGLSG